MKIRKYNLLSVPFFAFFSKKVYREVGKNWRGMNMAYLFLLMAVCCLPPAVALRKHITEGLENNQTHLINQIPDIQITDGRVLVDQREPLYITRKDGKSAMIIDTTGSMNYIEDPNVVALLMESSLIVRRGEKAFNTFDLSGVSDFYVDKHIVNGWLQTAKEAIAPISYSLFLMLSYTFALVALLLVSMISLIISAVMRHKLTFSTTLRIATVAATPSIILITLFSVLGLHIPEVIPMALTLVYLSIGIKACTSGSEADGEHIDLKAILHEEDISEQAA